MLPFLRKSLSRETPIVIGGTGGSGTRVVHELLEAAGIYMGSNLNISRDAMDFEPLLDEIINPVLQTTRSLDYAPGSLSPDLFARAQAGIRRAVKDYLRGKPRSAHWGWKNPRSMYVLPLIHSVFPALSFIHVVRDGRDMAFSPNQHQVEKHFSALFGEALSDLPRDSIRLWAKANGEAAAWAKRNLGPRYCAITFESLCAAPEESAQKLCAFANVSAPDPSVINTIVKAPPSIGRWREHDESTTASLQKIAQSMLKIFNYI